MDQLKMTVINTAPNGVVDHQTVFTFTQRGTLVTAEYKGGKITQGYLVGINDNNGFRFSYCQSQTDGKLEHGFSTCDLSITDGGKIRMVERFEWGSRDGDSGINIFEEQ